MRINKRIAIFLILFVSYLACALSVEQRYPFSGLDRDPFSPLITKSGQILVQRNIGMKNLNLKGIIYSDGGSVAVIEEGIYKKNDKIADYVIVKIGKKKVILKKGKELLILKLEEE